MPKFRKIPESETTYQLQFKCPGCNAYHAINHTWDFNGDYEFPTVSPSILVTGYHSIKDESEEYIRIPEICHSWITKGKIKFFNDCTHDKAGTKWHDLLEIENIKP